jgi:hypothetical protein
MPRLVEDAGKPLYSGWLSRVHALTGRTRGLRWIGRRRVRWFLAPDAVIVLHRPADPGRNPLASDDRPHESREESCRRPVTLQQLRSSPARPGRLPSLPLQKKGAARSARGLFVLVESLGPAVEGDELVFAADLPDELEPLVEVLHTGLGAQLAGKRWYGCDGARAGCAS